MTFSQFLRAPYTWGCNTNKRDGTYAYYKDSCDFKRDVFERSNNFLEIRTSKYKSWLAFDAPHKTVIRYEDAYADLDGTLGAVLDEFDIQRAHPIKQSAKKFTGTSKGKTSHKNMTVVEVLQKVHFSAEDMVFINQTLDWELEHAIGYTNYFEYFDAFERLHPGALAKAHAAASKR